MYGVFEGAAEQKHNIYSVFEGAVEQSRIFQIFEFSIQSASAT